MDGDLGGGAVDVEPAHAVEYVTPAPAVTCVAPTPVAEYVDPAPAATDVASLSFDELDARFWTLDPEMQRKVAKAILSAW